MLTFHRLDFFINLASCAQGLKTPVYDHVTFYHHFNAIPVQKLRDSHIIQRKMSQQFGKTGLFSFHFSFSYIRTDVEVRSEWQSFRRILQRALMVGINGCSYAMMSAVAHILGPHYRVTAIHTCIYKCQLTIHKQKRGNQSIQRELTRAQGAVKNVR